jgi:hypothetical protein
MMYSRRGNHLVAGRAGGFLRGGNLGDWLPMNRILCEMEGKSHRTFDTGAVAGYTTKSQWSQQSLLEKPIEGPMNLGSGRVIIVQAVHIGSVDCCLKE